MNSDQRAQARCREFEGRHVVAGRHVRHTCPAGHPTIGYGHRLKDGEGFDLVVAGKVVRVEDGLSEQEALLLFRADWAAHRDPIERALAKRGIDLSDVRKGVVAEMAFQLGVGGCLGFRRMWLALERRDFESAADEALDSEWGRKYRRRARRLAAMLRTDSDA